MLSSAHNTVVFACYFCPNFG